MSAAASNVRPPFDPLFGEIADYVRRSDVASEEALDTARWCLLDTLACGFLALEYPACTKLLGPTVPGLTMTAGARVPGTSYVLDPVTAAFNIGTLVRWLDFNDTWLAAEWGHPSDNLGALLAVCDWLGAQHAAGLVPTAFHTPLASSPPPTVRDLLIAMIKAHEIQGVLALANSFNRVGLDHVLLVRVASTAVATGLLGGSREQIMNALSHAWIDGSALRTYRHAPNTGSRKSWAAGDATSRAVRLALIALTGEMGYPAALSTATWGWSDVCFRGRPLRLERPLGSYVMENVLFKISFPAEFHAQTAVEAALQLHAAVEPRLGEIARIEVFTHESALRIIDKSGPLHNPADRDHCLQYMIAIGLIYGRLTASHYEDAVARDTRIDTLRSQMVIRENPDFSHDYLDPDKRSIANTVQVFYRDGTATPRITVEYPVGHRRRRAEGWPLLKQKARDALGSRLGTSRASRMLEQFEDRAALERLPVTALVSALLPA